MNPPTRASSFWNRQLIERHCEAESLLDLTVLGRQEEWEEPKGRVTGLGAQAGDPTIPYPDEYEFEAEA